MKIEIGSAGPVVGDICLRLGQASWAVLVCCGLVALPIFPPTAHAQSVTATVNAGSVPAALAVNPMTNKIYVASGPINCD